MKYFVAIRAIPGSNAKKRPNALPFEYHTPEQAREADFRNLNLKLNHNKNDHGIVGKVVQQWDSSDDSKIVLAYIEDSNLAGAISIKDIERGLLTGASISYEFEILGTPYEITEVKRKYLELSLTSQPDREDDSCKILFGAWETDLKLKADEYIKKLEDN